MREQRVSKREDMREQEPCNEQHLRLVQGGVWEGRQWKKPCRVSVCLSVCSVCECECVSRQLKNETRPFEPRMMPL